MYLSRDVYVGKVSAPCSVDDGFVPVRRPHEVAPVIGCARWVGSEPCTRRTVGTSCYCAEHGAKLDRVEAESAAVRVVPGMRCVDGRWLYSTRWL